MKVFAILCTVVVLPACGDPAAEVGRDTHELELMLGSGEESPILGITVPDTFEHERSQGVDFAVHYLKSADIEGAIGIYVGTGPNTFLDEPVDTKVGLLGAREVTWNSGKQDEGIVAETVVDWFLVPDPGYVGEINLDYRQLHIFVTARNEQDIQRLKEYSETLRLVRPSIPLKSEQGADGQSATAVKSKAE